MNLIAATTAAIERLPLPDGLTRAGISALVNRTNRRLDEVNPAFEQRFAEDMAAYPVAERTDAANEQHYELPPEFFALILGPRRKYSCCLYDPSSLTLAEAEMAALEATAVNAELANGQDILELGCGWGSLTLWMAERYPRSRITAVSNSHGQRRFIEEQAAARGFSNLQVITADMNDFAPGQRFDRIVSVEMWEHMSNWQALLGRARTWIHEDGRLFLHVFSHRRVPYRFETSDPSDWIAQHFFTGGIMPSHNMIRHLDHDFTVEQDWRWSGEHYRRTAEHWLVNYDANIAEIESILTSVYGADASLWRRRWRLFFLATSGLFGARCGEEWGVSHYRLKPV